MQYIDEAIEKNQQMIGTAITVIKFFLNFLDDPDVLVILVVLLRRFYNFFPDFRNDL